MKNVLFICALVLFCPSLEAATYYVTKAGNDAAGTGSISNPWLTINRGLGELSGGDTLLIGDGTYVEQINNEYTAIPSGLGSFASATKIWAINRRKVIIRPSGVYPMWYMLNLYNSTTEWLWFKGLVFDGINTNAQCIKFSTKGAGTYGYPHYIRIEDCEGVNGYPEIVHMGGAVPGNPSNLHSFGHELLNCDLHGTKSAQGVYVSNRNSVFRGCRIYHNHAQGVTMHESGSSVPTDITFDRCEIFDNGWDAGGGSADGIILSGAVRPSVTNCLIYSNYGTGINVNPSMSGATDGKFYNNTCSGNRLSGIIVSGTYAKGNTVRNNIAFGNLTGQITVGTGNTGDHNLTTDPSFVNATAGDFHLKSTSTAINAGYDLTGTISTDFDGNTRPYGGGWDMGAYEYKAASAIAQVFPTGLNRADLFAVRQTPNGISIRPNQFANTSFSIYTLDGRRMASFGNVGSNGANWNPGKSSAGVYLIRAQLANEAQTAKIAISN